MKPFVCFFVICFLAAGCGSSKDAARKVIPTEMSRSVQDPEETKPRFYAEWTNVITDDTVKTRAKLLISLVAPKTDLSFTTFQDGNKVRYRAKVNWEVKLSFNDPNKKIEVSDAVFIKRVLIADTYEETRLGVAAAEAFFSVTPNASYNLVVNFTDEETGITSKRVYPQIGSRLIRDKGFSLADPVIFAAAKIDSSEIEFVPLNSRRVDPWREIPFITLIYYPPKGEHLDLHYEIIGSDSKTIFEKNQTVVPTQATWTFDTLFAKLPDEAGNGKYTLIVLAKGEKGKQAEFAAVKNFDVYSLIPRGAEEFDKAADQMIYVASTRAVIDSIHKAQGIKEKKRLWLAFWGKIDPSPARSQLLMNEYYQRVNFANASFGTQILEGWKTDRGRVYIRFGVPDQVDRHPFESGAKPYEVWHYYQLRAKDTIYQQSYSYKFFIFVDRFGNDYNFGDGEIYLHNTIEFEN